jgi:hypothetical protein
MGQHLFRAEELTNNLACEKRKQKKNVCTMVVDSHCTHELHTHRMTSEQKRPKKGEKTCKK